MKLLMKLIIEVVLVTVIASCTRQPDYLAQALELAGGNRSELEKVLRHYKQDTTDSLKYRAAVFLISNMAGHYSCGDNSIESYYDELDSLSLQYAGRTGDTVQFVFERLGKKYLKSYPQTIPDLWSIKASYLIKNIDKAFDAWENTCWLESLDFDDFCEYILPYKVCEAQILDNWREYLSDEKYGDVRYLPITSCFSLRACQKINETLNKNFPSIQDIEFESPPTLRMNTLVTSMKARNCDDDSYGAAAVMRAKGVPIAIDFTPQWPQGQAGHTWCALLSDNGKHVPFNPFAESFGTAFIRFMSKAYRRIFAINPELLKLNSSDEIVPSLFRNVCMKDVTEEYTSISDIEVKIEKNKNRYAYLCTFNDYDWNPVAYGKIEGRKAAFKKVGRNVLYLVGIMTENGIEPVSDIFIVNHQGRIETVKPETAKSQTLKLYRKHFAWWGFDIYGHRSIGGKFQAANKADFSDSITLHVIDKFGTESDEIIMRSKDKYRYWRFLSAPDGWGHLSEVYYIKDGKNIAKQGRVMGIKGEGKNRQPENLYDNDPLTCYEAPAPSDCWSGLDFGEPITIDRILYAPRADGNCVTYGDEYELKYWKKDHWVSLGRKMAESIYIEFDNCPVNALFLLHDNTRGVEDRIFMYKNGKQIFW
jgi:hypothetical protein